MSNQRYAIDLGSTGIGLYGFCIDDIQNKEVYNRKERITLQGSIRNGIIPADVQLQVINAFKLLLTDIPQVDRRTIIGVATAWARLARNSQELLDLIEYKTGVHIAIIDQRREGEIALCAILANLRNTNIDPQSVISWDIGGGSMQFTNRNEKDSINVLGSTDSSTIFADRVIEIIKGEVAQGNTPNPLSFDQMNIAINLARDAAKTLFRDRSFIRDDIAYNIYGIGMLHKSIHQYIRISTQTNIPDLYRRDDLYNAALSLLNKNNTEIGNILGFKAADARNRLTSMLLILGFMEYLGVEEIKIANATGVLGLFFC